MARGSKVAHASVLVLLVSAAQLARAACVPPGSIAKELSTAPNAEIYAALGTWYAGQRQFGCAVQVFRKAVALDPRSAQDQYLLGLSLLTDGKSTEALEPLQRSLQLEPTSMPAHQTLGAALDATGHRPDAELEWRLVLARDPHSTLALESLSRDLLGDKNHSAVIALLEPLVASPSFTDTLAVDLAAAYSGSGLPQNAAAVLQNRLEHEPASLQLAKALSGALVLEGRFQDAVAVLSPVVRQHPSDMQAQVLSLQTLVLAHDPGAEALGRKLLTSAPRQWELLYFMGILHQQANDYLGARGYFERSIAAKPGDASAHYRLGMVLAALKEEAAARQELEKAVALGLDTPEVHVALAQALRAQGATAAAQQQFDLYRRGLQAQAARAQAADKAQQGDQAEAAGNPQQTAADYREALALDPQEPVLAYKLAMALDQTGDRAGERVALQHAIELAPGMAIAQNQLGYLDASDGDAEAAVHQFQLAVKADPAFSKAWLNLAASLCLQSKWPEARDALHHVLALGGDDAPARALLQRIDGMEAQVQR